MTTAFRLNSSSVQEDGIVAVLTQIGKSGLLDR